MQKACRRGLCALLLFAAAAPAAAAPATAAPTEVEELVVQPRVRCLPVTSDPQSPLPRVVSTFPAQGDVVRPGLLVVRVTFDRRMACSGTFAEAPPLPSPCPDGFQKLVLSLDRRTVRILCTTSQDGRYGLMLGTEPGLRFQSTHGQRLEPYALTFSTDSRPPVTTVPEALAEDRAKASKGGR